MTTRRLVAAAVVAALACFLLAQTAIAKSFECKYNAKGILYSDACLLSTFPPISSETGDDIDDIMGQVELLAGIPLGVLRCTQNSLNAVESNVFDIAEDINPICYTLVYEFDLNLPEVHVNFRLLFRGTWARTDAPEEFEYKTCKDMCNYFKRATTINIHMINARPVYLGCYHEPNKNDENIINLQYPPNGVDCSIYCGNGKPGPCDDNGGGNAAPWIVFGILMAALVVLVALGAAFWWLKLRTP